jgi:hypothetical protein
MEQDNINLYFKGFYMKNLTLTTLALMTFGFNAYALETNLCDDLIRDKAPQAQIDKCLASKKYGKSEFYLAQEAAKKALDQIEEKTFSKVDLDEESFGLPIYMTKATVVGSGSIQRLTLTTGTNLCRVLGFTKAKQIVYSHTYTKGNFKNISGVIAIDGSDKFVPLKGDNYISHYTPIIQITCVKTKDGDNKILESIIEEMILDTQLKKAAKVSEEKADVEVNDESRSAPKSKVQDFSSPVYDKVQMSGTK